MSGVLFLIWIPTENFEESEKNAKKIDGDQKLVEIGVEPEDTTSQSDSSIKEPKKTSSGSGDTYAISIENDDPTKSSSQSNLTELESLIPSKKSSSTEAIVVPKKVIIENGSVKKSIEVHEPMSPAEELDFLDPQASMEKIMHLIIRKMKINNCTWLKGKNENSYQITFCVESGTKCDDIIHLLSEWGIGQREGSSISIIPCNLYFDPEQQQEQDDEAQSISTKDTAWTRFISSVRARLNVAKIVQEVKADAALSFDYISLLIVASITAAFGLFENNTLFLAASMLISPLMGPIIAATFGTVIKDSKLQFIGIKNELIGLALVTLVGFVFALITCSIGEYGQQLTITNEIMSRGTTHSVVVGIMIALPSGAAVAIAILGENVGSLVGVAISASLLPPAVNAGLLWALSLVITTFEKHQAREAVKTTMYSENPAIELGVMGCVSMCVTLTNIFCIYLMGIIFLKIKEVAPITSPTHRQFWKHDIKIARDYNKTGHHNHEDPESRLMDGIVDHETMNFRGLRAEHLKSHQTWSPMTLRHRRDSCPVRPTMRDLEAFYVINKINERGPDYTINSKHHDTIATDRYIHIPVRNKWPLQDTWYTSTKHTHDSMKPSSVPLERIEEIKNLFERESASASAQREEERSSHRSSVSNGEVKRKFIVTLADDPLKEN